MNKKPISFFLDEDGKITSAEITVDDVVHHTADIRKEYKGSDKLTVVTSQTTVAEERNLEMVNYLVDQGIYSKLTVDSFLVNESSDLFTYSLLLHPSFKKLTT